MDPRSRSRATPAASGAIADQPPAGAKVTDYDRAHLVTYLRLLDADAAGADWRDAARQLLEVDPHRDADRARLRYETHAARARWMSSSGYLELARRP